MTKGKISVLGAPASNSLDPADSLASKAIKVSSTYLQLPDGRMFRCALGKAGIVDSKVEGDKATPAGILPLKSVLYRADRVSKPETRLPVRAMKETDAWIDDPDHVDYNTHARLPIDDNVSHERMWYDGHLYDVVVLLGYNDNPVVPNKGSAIFMHIARNDYGGTAGCITLSHTDLMAVLKVVGPGHYLEIAG